MGDSAPSVINPTRRDTSHRWRLAVLDPASDSRAGLIAAVEAAGLDVALADRLHPQAVLRIRRARWDVLLLGLDEPDLVAAPLVAELDRPVVLCSGNPRPEMIGLAERIGAMAFLLRPLSAAQIIPTTTVAVSRFRERQSLSRALAERKLIERAKGRLMDAHGLSEDNAFRQLRRRAMNLRARLADVARDVLSESRQT